MRPRRLSAATLLAFALASSTATAISPPSTVELDDEAGDAGYSTCSGSSAGFTCTEPEGNNPNIDILAVAASLDGNGATVTLTAAADLLPGSDNEDYHTYGIDLYGLHGSTSDTRTGVSLSRTFRADGTAASTSTLWTPGEDRVSNPPECSDFAFAVDGPRITFGVPADCLALAQNMGAVWVSGNTQAAGSRVSADGTTTRTFDPDTRTSTSFRAGPAFTPSAVAQVDRIAGGTRFDTAVQVATRQFPDGADTVYLARAIDPLVDALAGGMVTDGPVLLVPADGPVPNTVHDAIAQIDPDTVVALGGTGAISQQVLQDAAGTRPADREAGGTRYDTAVLVSQRMFPDGADTVYLARGIGVLVDAIAGGTLTDGPVLLVPPTGDLPDVVTAEIDRINPDTVIALGGTGAVSDQVLAAAAAGRPSDRLAGDTRYATAITIARATRPDPSTIYLARAVDPLVDALAGGMVTDGPIILVPADGALPAEVDSYLTELAPDVAVIVLGGNGAISNNVVGAVVNATRR